MLALVALLAGCAEEVGWRAGGLEYDALTVGSFYRVDDPAPGEPGELIRKERMLGAPEGAEAWRILYHSTDQLGNDVVVSGMVVVPDGPAPEGGRTVVSWGHPTTGVARHCAPTLSIDPFFMIEGLGDLLDAGFAVAATDYSGMGADGPSAYLVGSAEAHNVLDAVRAAGHLDVGTSDRVLLWGHSQGGHAALFAAQEAAEYAPDLDLLGVAVAAPATDLGALFDADVVDQSGVTLGSYAIAAYVEAYESSTPAPTASQVLTPAGVAVVPKIAPICLLLHQTELHKFADPLVGTFLRADPATTPPWSSLLEENSAGGAPIDVPVLVAQGLADVLVKPPITKAYVERLCAAGEHVEYREVEKATHGLIAFEAAPAVAEWFEALDAGRPVRDGCSQS